MAAQVDRQARVVAQNEQRRNYGTDVFDEQAMLAARAAYDGSMTLLQTMDGWEDALRRARAALLKESQ